MKDINKYRGIIPAFYACYAPDGSISTEGVKALTRHLIAKGVKAFTSAAPPASASTSTRMSARPCWRPS